LAIAETDSRVPVSAAAPDVFAAAVDAHWPAVYRLLFCITGNAHDAEELTQETFLRAWRRFDSFRPGTRLRAWLLRIATNAGLDVQRQRKRARQTPLPDDLPERQNGPGHRLETAEQAALLMAAMNELSETTRTVFHLRATESLSFREIAAMLDTTEQAARWHMHQARRKLVKHWDA
jgi:RNA polymerase sigma-70 factor (ECF subfamily)